MNLFSKCLFFTIILFMVSFLFFETVGAVDYYCYCDDQHYSLGNSKPFDNPVLVGGLSNPASLENCASFKGELGSDHECMVQSCSKKQIGLDTNLVECQDIKLVEWDQKFGSPGNYEERGPGEAFNKYLQASGQTSDVVFSCSNCKEGSNLKSYVLNTEKGDFTLFGFSMNSYIGKGVLTVIAMDTPGQYKINLKATQTVDKEKNLFYTLGQTLFYKVSKPEEVVTPQPTAPKPTAPSQPTQTEIKIPSLENLNQLKVSSVPDLIGNLIKTATGLMGSIALVMFVFGGLLWMTAVGNAEQQKKATNIILWASLGLLVILSSYVIVEFVFGVF